MSSEYQEKAVWSLGTSSYLRMSLGMVYRLDSLVCWAFN